MKPVYTGDSQGGPTPFMQTRCAKFATIYNQECGEASNTLGPEAKTTRGLYTGGWTDNRGGTFCPNYTISNYSSLIILAWALVKIGSPCCCRMKCFPVYMHIPSYSNTFSPVGPTTCESFGVTQRGLNGWPIIQRLQLSLTQHCGRSHIMRCKRWHTAPNINICSRWLRMWSRFVRLG